MLQISNRLGYFCNQWLVRVEWLAGVFFLPFHQPIAIGFTLREGPVLSQDGIKRRFVKAEKNKCWIVHVPTNFELASLGVLGDGDGVDDLSAKNR